MVDFLNQKKRWLVTKLLTIFIVNDLKNLFYKSQDLVLLLSF